MNATLNEITDHIQAGRHEEARQALDATDVTDENRYDVKFLRGYLQERMYDREGALGERMLDLGEQRGGAGRRAL